MDLTMGQNLKKIKLTSWAEKSTNMLNMLNVTWICIVMIYTRLTFCKSGALGRWRLNLTQKQGFKKPCLAGMYYTIIVNQVWQIGYS